MRQRFLVLTASAALFFACADNEATVRQRQAPVEGGTDLDAGDGGDGSTCALTLTSTYDSPTFETNAAQELLLRRLADEMLGPFRQTETAIATDAGVPAVAKSQLVTLYGNGSPSLKLTSSVYYQTKVDAWFGAYEAATQDGTYEPATPSAAEKGGVLGKYMFDGTGVDLKQVIETGTQTAAFYNQAASLVQFGPITVGTIDRLIAAFGAHPSFPNNPNAAQYRDVNAAAYAAKRDSKGAERPGPYQKIRAHAIRAKAAVVAGASCDGERDLALKAFLLEWERAIFASAVHALSAVVTTLGAQPVDYGNVLHSYGEAIGLISGFKTLPKEQRLVTDAQIDALLTKLFATDGLPIAAYRLKTEQFTAGTNITEAIGEIKALFGFTDSEMQEFKLDY